ncbi:MAG: beta strand repeat-containing protein, partial [Planctomycetota bacterium]
MHVNVVAGSFKTVSGAKNVAETEGFTVISQAPTFEIYISGGIYYLLPVAIEGTDPAPGEEGTTELFGLEGKIVLRVDQKVDDAGTVQETRFTLDFSATMRLIYLGNIASATGRLVLVTGNDTPQFWGVISLETNFEKLIPLGIEVDLFATLQINVTNQEKTETITLEGQAEGGGDLTETYVLAPNLFRIDAAGKLLLGIPKLDGSGIDIQLLEIRGAFSFIISSEGLTVFARGLVSFGPADFQLAELDALGLLIINDDGFSLRLELTRGIDNIPLLEFNASFALIINTTKKNQEFEVPSKFFEFLSEGFIDELQYGQGDLLFSTSVTDLDMDSLNDGTMPSSVTSAFSSAGKTLSGSVTVRTIYNDTRWEIVDSAGNEYILEGNDQIAGQIDIYESKGKKFVVIPRGPPQTDGSLGEATEFVIVTAEGNLNIADLLTADGTFRMQITPDRFDLFMQAEIDLDPLGDAGLVGTLVIDENGAYGSLEMSLAAGLEGSFFNIQGTFLLELNTTGQDQTVKSLNIDNTTGAVGDPRLIDATLSGDTTLRIVVAAEMTIAEIFKIKGRIEMIFTEDGFALNFDAVLDLGFFGKIEVSGGAIIEGDVLAIYLNLGAKSLGFGPFTLSGDFTLEINTSSDQVEVNGHTIDGSTFLVSVSAELKIWVLTAEGSITLGIDNGQFLMSLDSLTINFFDFVTLNISGFIKGDGSFEVEASVTIDIPLGPFRLEGGIELRIANGGADGFTLWGRAWGSISIHIGLPWPLPDIDITLASIEGFFEYRAASIRLGIKISVVILGTLRGEIVWSFGTPTLARMSGSTLYLNMGVDASHRGQYFDTDSAESYSVTHAGGTAGSESITVAAMGESTTYHGVSKIVVTDAGNGDDYVQIGSDVLADVEINGGVGNDQLLAFGSGSAVLRGGEGDDQLYGSDAADTIEGGDGNDVIFGGEGNNTLDGGAGNDDIEGGSDNDTITGGDGNDTILGHDGDDTINAGAGNDTIEGGEGDDTIDGGVGDDTIEGGAGDDIIQGGDGEDTIDGNDGDDKLFGDLGGLVSGKWTSSSATGARDIIHGNAGNDVIIGGPANDDIYGDDGDDILLGDLGQVQLSSGDIVLIQTTNAGTGGNDTIYGGAGMDQLLGGAGNDTLYGDGGNDQLAGDYANVAVVSSNFVLTSIDTTSGGNDFLYGNAGDDILIGGFGNDTLSGGTGRDLLAGDNGKATFSDAGVFLKFETFNLTAGGDDTLDATGSEGADWLIGGAGNDSIYGGSGNDTDVILGDHGVVFGGDGSNQAWHVYSTNENDGDADTLDGGAGSDIILGGSGGTDSDGVGGDSITGGTGNDFIAGDHAYVTRDASEAVTRFEAVNAAFGYSGVLTTGGNDVIDQTGNAGADIIMGGFGADMLYGGETDSANDIIFGDHGEAVSVAGAFALSGVRSTNVGNSNGRRDVINGGPGNDILFGGGDVDTIYGHAGDDYIEGDDGNDHLFGDLGSVTGGDTTAETGTLSVTGNDEIYGDADNDSIFGGPGNDTIYGGAGDDALIGDAGKVVRDGTGAFSTIATSNYAVAGNDEIYGDAGDDNLFGGSGSDPHLIGGAANDRIFGDNGSIVFGSAFLESLASDTNGGNDGDIQGNGGHDVIIGGVGKDTITGDAGNDVLLGDSGKVMSDATNAALHSDNNIVSFLDSGSDADIIRGGADNDIIIGGSESSGDKLSGDAGADIILGDNGEIQRDLGTIGAEEVLRISTLFPANGGNDVIDANDEGVNETESTGADIIIGGTGNDEISGGWDNSTDVLLGDNGVVVRNDGTALANDIFSTDPDHGGNDTINGGGGTDLIIGGSHNLYAVGAAGDTIFSGAGDDHIFGDNAWFVRDGNDVLTAVHSTDPTYGDNDTIDVGKDNGGADTIVGGVGDDTLAGGQDSSSDILIGDSAVILRSQANNLITTAYASVVGGASGDDLTNGGLDTISGGGGADLIIGGSGGRDAGSLGDTLSGDDGADMLIGDNAVVDRNISDVVLRITSSHSLNGGRDTISGNGGNDMLVGGFGNDVLNGNGGADTILGDSGVIVRTEVVDAANNDVWSTFAGDGGNDTINAGSGDDLVIGGAANDTIYGNDGVDVLLGDSGSIQRGVSDVIQRITSTDPAIGGDDFIYGQLGADMIIGGVANDTLSGGDTSADGGTDDESTDVIIGDNGEIVRSYGAADDNDIYTTYPMLGGNDTIIGGLGDDILLGGSGGTDLRDAGGGDIITGNGGDDIIFGDGAHITRGAGDVVELVESIDFAHGGNDQIDYLSGSEGADRIFGGAASDRIDGGPGEDNDVIFGDNGRIGLTLTDKKIYSTD